MAHGKISNDQETIRKKYTSEFCLETLKLAERICMVAVARELSLQGT
jgi:hypothetical protein